MWLCGSESSGVFKSFKLGSAAAVLSIAFSACGSPPTENNLSMPQTPGVNRNLGNNSNNPPPPPPPAPNIIPMPAGALAFGGMYSTGPFGNSFVNPVTNSLSCPSGFSTVGISGYLVFGSNAPSDKPNMSDQNIYLCSSPNPSITQVAAFGGMFSTTTFAGVTTNYNNPITGAQSCPEKFTAVQILGSNNDSIAYYCLAKIADLASVTSPLKWAFAGAFSNYWDTSVSPAATLVHQNPATNLGNCPAGFSSGGPTTGFPIYGTPLKDSVFNICLTPQNGGTLSAPVIPPSMPVAGLKGEYFTLDGGSKGTRVDLGPINYGVSPDAPTGSIQLPSINGFVFGRDVEFKVKWSGFIMAPVSGTYTFTTYVDDGVILNINGTSVINQWAPHDHATFTGSIVLTAGQIYPFELNFYNGPGEYAISLSWAAPGISKQLVPPSAFYHTPF